MTRHEPALDIHPDADPNTMCTCGGYWDNERGCSDAAAAKTTNLWMKANDIAERKDS